MNSHVNPIFAGILDRYVSGGSRGHKNFVREAVRGRRSDAADLLDAGVRFLQRGIDAGISSAFLQDTAAGLHDQISNLVGIMRRDLDNESLPIEGADVDVSELDAIIAKLEALS